MVVAPMTRLSDLFYRSVEVFSRFLAEVAQDVGEVITLDGCNST